MRNGFFNSLNRVNQNVNLIMKDIPVFKGSGFQRCWFWLSFGFGWFWFFQVRIQGFQSVSGFQEFGFSGFGFKIWTWTVSDFSGFGFRGLLNSFRLDKVL